MSPFWHRSSYTYFCSCDIVISRKSYCFTWIVINCRLLILNLHVTVACYTSFLNLLLLLLAMLIASNFPFCWARVSKYFCKQATFCVDLATAGHLTMILMLFDARKLFLDMTATHGPNNTTSWALLCPPQLRRVTYPSGWIGLLSAGILFQNLKFHKRLVNLDWICHLESFFMGKNSHLQKMQARANNSTFIIFFSHSIEHARQEEICISYSSVKVCTFGTSLMK